jgi:hypothetical protein
MSNRTQTGRSGRRVPRVAIAMLTLIAVGGCQDLNVENLVNPDRERATGNPSDVEAFIGGAFFPSFWQALHGTGTGTAVGGPIASAFPLIASEFTSTMSGNNTLLWWDDVKEPRVRHDNGAFISVGNGPHGPRAYWTLTGRSGSIAFDGLQLLDGGVVIRDGSVDVTPRARAYAKFMQGWVWGYQAMIFEQAHVVPESVRIPGDPNAVLDLARSSLKPHPEVLAAALASLDQAIAIARQNPTVVRFPAFAESPLWFQSAEPISNQKFIQMANTLAARLIVLSARTPQERTSLDWARVLRYTAEGLTSDYEVQLSTSRTSQLILRNQTNVATGVTNHRVDYRVIGPADQSGAYQAWINGPLAQRNRFNITTPDRRITGASPTSDGAYLRFRADDNGFEPDRGRYLYSAYQWGRHAIRHGLTGTNTGNNSGTFPMMSADENRLLRAEALLRTNDRQGAADLINVSRTRQQRVGTTTHPGLPPVTAAGVPMVNGACVPRTDTGACGDLLTAIRYERMLELLGTDNVRGFADSRGFGTLPTGTILSWPIPGDALQLYEMEGYSYGGVGEPNTATYAPQP